jgi:hypothetical protein
MESTQALRANRFSSGVVAMFVVAVIAALLLGGVGGYAIRALSFASSPANNAPILETRPNTMPQQTFGPTNATQPTSPQPTDPSGHVIPI